MSHMPCLFLCCVFFHHHLFRAQLLRFFGFTQAPETLSSALERPVSAAPGLFQAGQKNGNAVNPTYGGLELSLVLDRDGSKSH